jgi:hypothetical protein
MFDDVRRALEPTACQVFPISLLYMPLIYWVFVLLFFLFSSSKRTTLFDLAKISTVQTFKNAFSMHPSSYVAGIALLVVVLLEYACAFPVVRH